MGWASEPLILLIVRQLERNRSRIQMRFRPNWRAYERIAIISIVFLR